MNATSLRIRLNIECRGWKYRLHVREQQPGIYFVALRELDGAALKHPVATGAFPSLDLIRAQAATIYAKLVAMREANATAAISSASVHETTLNHSAEFSAQG